MASSSPRRTSWPGRVAAVPPRAWRGGGADRRPRWGAGGGRRRRPPQAHARFGRRSAVEVVEVVPDSPAADAGLRPEDLLLDVDGQAVERVEDLQRILSAEMIGR